MADKPDVATTGLLDGTNNLRLNHNLFRGPVRQPRASIVPHKSVFVLATGGSEPIRCINGNAAPRLRFSTVQVTVRSDVASYPDSFQDGQELARNVWETLEAATVSGYVWFDCQQSEPVYIGQDDTEHHRWVVNLETLRNE